MVKVLLNGTKKDEGPRHSNRKLQSYLQCLSGCGLQLRYSLMGTAEMTTNKLVQQTAPGSSARRGINLLVAEVLLIDHSGGTGCESKPGTK